MFSADSQQLLRLLTALGAFVGIAGILLALRLVAFRALRRWAATTTSLIDDIIFHNLRIPSIFWCLLVGLYVALDLAHFPPRPTALGLKILYALLVLSVTAAAANVAGAGLAQVLKERQLPIPATGLSFTIFKATVWSLGLLVLLGSLGVSVTPILTALGVGGLAVALALQETLSNFFAGVHLLLSRPIRVGDFVKLETGQEGYVVDIGWRSTKLQMPQNNIVVVPNSKMAQSILINYSMPDPRMAVTVQVGVAYDADPDVVERTLLDEAAKAAEEVPGLLKDPPAVARLIPGFGESSLDFTVTCFVQSYEDHAPAQHALRKRIYRRFRSDGIDIPFPQRTIHIVPAGVPAPLESEPASGPPHQT